jgi:hypothetical protein
VAATEGVTFVDLNEIIARRYDELGPEKVEPMFADPHTSPAGVELNAVCVIAGLKGLQANPPETFFSAKSATVGDSPPLSERHRDPRGPSRRSGKVICHLIDDIGSGRRPARGAGNPPQRKAWRGE